LGTSVIRHSTFLLSGTGLEILCISANVLLSTNKREYNRRNKKGKAIPLQAWRDPERSRRMRLPDFNKIGT
jgi:hypothetical protein